MKNSQVRFYEETLVIPTYEPGESDVLPPLLPAMCPRGKAVYPYPLQELTGSEKKDVEYRALILENDFLKLTFLPSLGGRMISAFDKIRKREIFFRNPVLKPVMAGLTGAWCGIGVEFNFPGSHSVTSNTPVHCSGECLADGSARITISDREFISGMKWRIRITLKPNSSVIHQESFFFNRTSLPHHGYFWTNAKAPAFPDTEFIFPEKKSGGLIHPPMDITRIIEFTLPFINDVDISKYADVFFQLPLFFRNMRSSSFGIYHREKDEGILHYADCGDLPGRKIWTLGTGDDGRITNHNLTEDGAPNIEIQSGPLPVQTDFFFLKPGQEHCWHEYWIPVHSMGKHLAGNQCFTLSLDGENLLVQCHEKRENVFLELGSEHFEFISEPGQVLTFPAPATLDFVRIESGGFALLEWRRDDVFMSFELEDVSATNTAESYYLQGLYCQELNKPDQADELFRKSLKIDPWYTEALKGLAVNCLKKGNYPAAVGFLRKALYRNRRCSETSYYLGLALLKSGDFTEGCFQLRRARFSTEWRLPATVELIKHHLKRHELLALEELFNEAEIFANEQLLELYAIYLRRLGKDNSHVLKALSRIAPENLLPENSRPAAPDAGKVQFLMELYEDAGCPKDAQAVGSFYAGDHVFLNYFTGQIEKAEKISIAGNFPFSAYAAAKLAALEQEYPQFGKISYYLGVLPAASGDWEQAMKKWRRAESLGVADPALFRNMGLCEWKIHRNLPAAISYYARGFAGITYKYAYEYDMLLDEAGETDKRTDMLNSLPPGIRRNPYIRLRMAKLAFDRQEFEEAIRILESEWFVLCEGKRMTSSIFIEANLALGQKQDNPAKALEYFRKALSYPWNLGVGRSVGCFDMKIKYYILQALREAGETEQWESQRAEYLRECEKFAIDFRELNTIRWESGPVSEDRLLLENQEYYQKIKEFKK